MSRYNELKEFLEYFNLIFNIIINIYKRITLVSTEAI